MKVQDVVTDSTAMYLSGDFEEYWAFHVKQDQGQLHPPGAWRPVQEVVEE